MAYSEKLAQRIRLKLVNLPNIEEREMMGGLTFMYNGKMCVGIIGDELMCRLDPHLHEMAIEKNGCRAMDFTKRPMKGFVMVENSGMRTVKDFDDWIELALSYNAQAIAKKKKK